MWVRDFGCVNLDYGRWIGRLEICCRWFEVATRSLVSGRVVYVSV